MINSLSKVHPLTTWRWYARISFQNPSQSRDVCSFSCHACWKHAGGIKSGLAARDDKCRNLRASSWVLSFRMESEDKTSQSRPGWTNKTWENFQRFEETSFQTLIVKKLQHCIGIGCDQCSRLWQTHCTNHLCRMLGQLTFEFTTKRGRGFRLGKILLGDQSEYSESGWNISTNLTCLDMLQKISP